MRTPWGTSDYEERLAPGITWYGTPSHGGVKVSPYINIQIHPAWRREDGWYEEDCDWAIVAFHFPRVFAKSMISAYDTLRNWHPDAYTKVTGIELRPEESYILRNRLEKQNK